MVNRRNIRMDTHTRNILVRIAETGFSLWCLTLMYSIYMLMVITADINVNRNQTINEIMSNCSASQNATNFIVNNQNNSTITASINNANINMASLQASLATVANLQPQLVNAYSGVKFGVYTIPNQALVTMSTTGTFINNNVIQIAANKQINTNYGNILNNFNSFINSFLGYNTFLGYTFNDALIYGDIITSGISCYVGSYILSGACVVIPSPSFVYPTIITPTMTVTNISMSYANYSTQSNNVNNLVTPLFNVQSAINSNTFNNISLQQIMNNTSIASIQDQSNNFCSQIDTSQINDTATAMINSIYTAVYVLAALIVFMFIVEISIIIRDNNRSELYSRSNDSKLMNVIKHPWFKSGITCLLIGVIGIVVYTILISTINTNKEQYIINNVTPTQTYITVTTDNTGNAMEIAAVNFANIVNNQILGINTLFNNLQTTGFSVNQTMTTIQTAISNALNTTINLVMPGFSIASTLNFNLVPGSIGPLVPNLYSLVSNLGNNFPVITPEQLNYDTTTAQNTMSASVNNTLLPFNKYSYKLQAGIQIYYFFIAYGSFIVMITIIHSCLFSSSQSHLPSHTK